MVRTVEELEFKLFCMTACKDNEALVTPEMIEGGMAVVRVFAGNHEPEKMVESIYRIMLDLRPDEVTAPSDSS